MYFAPQTLKPGCGPVENRFRHEIYSVISIAGVQVIKAG